jgi:hypothetical protein
MAITDAGLGLSFGSTAAFQDYWKYLVSDDYLPFIADARNNASVALGYMPTSSVKVKGKWFVYPVKYGRNMNSFNSVRDDQGKLPDPGVGKSAMYAARSRTTFARLLLSYEAIEKAMGEVAYVEPIEDLMSDLANDMAVEENRKLHNDGSGRLAEVASGVSSTTQTLRINQSIESPATCTNDPTQWINVDDRLAFVSATGTIVGIRTITSKTATTVTFSGALATTTGDWVVRVSGSYTGSEVVSSGYRTEMMGFAGILSDAAVADGTGISSGQTGTDDFTTAPGSVTGFQGIVVSTNTWNQVTVMANSGVLRDPTEQLLHQAFATFEETNNGKVDLMMSGYGERLKYGEGLLPDKRYVSTTELKGGYTALSFGDGKAPWVVDRDCYRNRIYLFGFESGGWQQYIETPFRSLTHQGAPEWMRLQDDAKYQAGWVMAGNNGVDVRQRAGLLITDVSRTATI